MNIAIITSFYNPCGYERLISNYWQFRKNLDHELFTAEVSYNGEFEIHDSLQIHSGPLNVMWQKERLLNLLISQLDPKYDAVAWIDADIIFQNPNWLKDTLNKLQTYPVVQLLEKLDYFDPEGNFIETKSGWASTQNQLGLKFRFPGGCWAARREVVEDGLYDRNVVGGGDAMLLYSWAGKFEQWLMKRMNKEWLHHYLSWGVGAYRKVNGKIGYTPGRATHLYHGNKKNRNYINRWIYLTDYRYDPNEDLRIGGNGLLEWCSDKPDMHKAVAGYFSERKEDD